LLFAGKRNMDSDIPKGAEGRGITDAVTAADGTKAPVAISETEARSGPQQPMLV
jgi:hypothetical protein